LISFVRQHILLFSGGDSCCDRQ